MTRGFGLLLIAWTVAAQPTLRDAADARKLLIGAAADANEFGPNRLLEPAYAATLGSQFNMLEAENAMKWGTIRPSQLTYNFGPGDLLVAFAQAHGMKVRGHNLCWYSNNPAWLTSFAASATPSAMSGVFQDYIATVSKHYRGQVFAWDVVNEAFGDNGVLRNSIWYNQPGIGLTGTGYIEQAFRWAHDADPDALLFYNDYNIEAPGAKFTAVMNMVKDFVNRGVPIHGVGLQMHLTGGSSYPLSSGLAEVIRQVTALGLQVHITEMDVQLKVDAAGNASVPDLDTQSQTYGRILTVCLQNPGCTAVQTWGFTDKYSWIPGFHPGYGAALPFDVNYQPKGAFQAIVDALQAPPPTLTYAGIVNAASYQGGSVAPGELVTVYDANDGPAPIVGVQLDGNNRVASNLAGAQIFFDGTPAPLIYAEARQLSAVVPYEVAGKQEVTVQYQYNGVKSNGVVVGITGASPGVFAQDSSGRGAGSILNEDYRVNTASNPAAVGSVVQIFATGAGTVAGGAVTGALAPAPAQQTLKVTATIGGVPATVIYAGPAPGLVNGVLQVNAVVPGVAAGVQAVAITVGSVASQAEITVAVR